MTVHGQRGGIWWANPLSPVLFVVLPLVVFAWAVPGDIYLEYWRTPKYFEFPALFRAIVALSLFCIGALVATRGRLGLAARSQWPALSPVATATLAQAFVWLYRITLAAYAIWVALAVQRGLRFATVFESLISQSTFSGELKREFATVSGITTLTQLGLAASVVGALLWSDSDRTLKRRVGLLVALAMLRGFFLAERLAIIEIVLPWLVIRSGRLAATRQRRHGRLLVRMAPVLAIPGLLLVFALFEYSRSWTYAKTRTDATFAEYSGYRILGYYATSFNNGELLRITTDRSEQLPFGTVEFVWEAPVLSSLVTYDSVVGRPPRPDSIARLGNPEFNSPGGVSSPFIDYGDFGGAVYFLGIGALLGSLYRGFAGSQMMGLLLYPVFFVGLLELPRYLYWAQGRTTVPFVALLAVGVLVTSRARRARSSVVNLATR